MTSTPATATTPVAADQLSGTVAGATMHHDLSIFGLFMNADLVVKTVMMILIFMSVWCWTIMIHKRMNLKKLNRRADRFEDAFWSGEPMDKLYQRVKNLLPILYFRLFLPAWKNGRRVSRLVFRPLKACRQVKTTRRTLDVNRHQPRNEYSRTRHDIPCDYRLNGYIYWSFWDRLGIMNSFTAIASMNNTSLAVVAPGIAEALFATAAGLVAAIPAMVAYNVFSSRLARYADRLHAFATEFTAIMSRHLDSSDRGAASSRRVA